MQAFPKDSLNNSIGGSGPLRQQADHSAFMGNATDEAFRDYATSGKAKGYDNPNASRTEAAIFDPVSRGQQIHGDESIGLGTSTFLEGTPAARTTIARRQAEQAQEATDGGLQRKKSLAQRIRQINRGPRDISASGRLTSPDGLYNKSSPDAMPAATSAPTEPNPFFAEFSKGEERISVGNRDKISKATSPPPIPRRESAGGPLERRATIDAAMPSDESSPKPTGLLGRMKSLKGVRKPKPAEPAANMNPGTVS